MRPQWIALLVVSLSGTRLWASEVPANPPAESPWRIGIAVGLGERSNPLIQSEDVPLLLDVDLAYFGKRWFFDNGDLGITVADAALGTVNIVARVNSDRVFFSRTNTRLIRVGPTGAQPLDVAVKPPDRDYAIELGAEAIADGAWGQATLSAYADVSGTHRGYEFSAAYSYRWQRQRWSIAPALQLRYKDTKLNDYYWGVRAEEANEGLAAYRASGGLNWQADLRATYFVNKKWRLALSASYQRLDSSIERSPIVDDAYVLGYFGGFAYRF